MLASYDFRMATRTVIELVDDLDGSQASETIRFGLDGTEYEIDLTEQNAGSLRSALTRYVAAGRKTGGATRRQINAVAPAVDTKAIRRWAAENGVAVNPRGRIKEDVVQGYLSTLS
jgi:hypothetical protein